MSYFLGRVYLGGLLTSDAPDPITPADGIQNLVGALEVTGSISFPGDLNATTALDLDSTGAIDILAATTFSIDGTGASNLSATAGELTLSTITSGDLTLVSAATVNVNPGGVKGVSINQTKTNASLTPSPMLTLVGDAHGDATPLAASTEVMEVLFNFDRTITFETGALALQRSVLMDGATYAFAGASTITTAATLVLEPATAGANATITNNYALHVDGDMALTQTKKILMGVGEDDWIASNADSNISFFLANAERFTFSSSGAIFADNKPLYWGASSDCSVGYETTVQEPDTMLLGVPLTSNAIIIAQQADLGTAYGRAQAADPTIWLQSSTAGSPLEYLSLAYNKLATGASELELAPAATFGVTLTQTKVNASSTPAELLSLVGGAHGDATPIAASAEATSVLIDLSATVTFETGALALQRSIFVDGPTLAFAGASTITDYATLYVEPATAGANATISNNYAAWFAGGIYAQSGVLTDTGYAVEGVSTSRNIMRAVRAQVTGTADATTCTAELFDAWNGEALAVETIDTDTPTGGTRFDIAADGETITVKGLTKVALFSISHHLHSTDVGTDWHPHGDVAGGKLTITATNSTTGVAIDFSAAAINGKVIDFDISYLTSD